MQFHFSADGTTLEVYVPVYDWENGVFVDPDGWSANPNSASIVIQEQPSAFHSGTKLGTGQYKFAFSGLTPIAANTVVNVEINGAISAVAWPEWIEQVTVARHPLNTLGGNAPAGWINPAAINSTVRVKLDATQPDYAPSKAGDAMALTSGERTSLAGTIETELLNDASGGAFLAGIASQLQALFDQAGDIPVATLVNLISAGVWTNATRTLTAMSPVTVGGYSAGQSPVDLLTSTVSKVTAIDAVLTALTEVVATVTRFKAAALSEAPSGAGGGGSGTVTEFDGDALDQVNQLLTQTAQISGARITYAGPVKSGGRIVLFAGDDYRVRANSNILLPVSDAGQALYTRLTSVALGSLKFAASFDDADPDLIVGSIAGVTHASGVTSISIEIPDSGITAPAKFRDGYEYHIQRTTADGDKVTEVTGLLELRRDRCA